MRHSPLHRLSRAFCAAVLGIAASPASAAPFVYTGNYYTGDVSVFDTVTRQLVATVPVGARPFPIAISADGSRMLVGNSGSNTVSIVETGGHTVVATLGVGQNPYGIAIKPDGTRAYVANYASADVTVIDLTTNTVVKTIPVGTALGGVAVNPQGTRAYVTIGGSNAIAVIDTATDTIVATIANAGTSPWAAVFSADGTRAFVSNFSGANVSVIDTATNTVITRWNVGNSPVGVALAGDGARLYVANSASDTLSIVDTTGGIVLNDLPVGHRPFGVSVHPDGRTVYVLNAGDPVTPGTISIVDGLANVVLATIPTAVYSGSVGNYVSPYTPPGTPTGVSAAPGVNKATVSFIAPFSDGGQPISSYTATCGTQTRVGSASPIVVDMLANGVTVACTVYATNARGNGAPSAPAGVTPANLPGAPAITGVVVGNASVGVSFTPPGSDGGAAISGYVATCGSASVPGSVPTILVTGLPNGTPVTCTVSATSVIGTGPASAPSASVTPMTVPGAPTLVSATRGVGGVSLAFDAPADDGGDAVSGYVAACGPGALEATGMQSPIVVTGLDEDTAYDCSVSAINAVGTGAASNGVAVPPRPTVDLAVGVDNGTGYVQGGSDVVYTIDVSNLGANGVVGAHVADALGADVESPHWTCSATGGAQCPASGSGAIDLFADIPAGASIRITLTVHAPPLPETPLSESVTVTVPVAWRDTDASNDTASDGPDPRGLFGDGFE